MQEQDMEVDMADAVEASNLLQLVKQLLLEKAYDGVRMLFQSAQESERNTRLLPHIAMQLYHDVCSENLCDEVNAQEPELFDCSDELLKLLAKFAPLQELMLELMERLEESSSLNVFGGYLRALQVVLQRQGRDKPQAVEWSLQSILTKLRELPLPNYLSEGYDEAQARLIEQNEQVEDLLAHYITVGLFRQPLCSEILQQDVRSPSQIFRDCGLNRRNVFTCFFTQLLGRPLALLEMSHVKEDLTRTYVQQVTEGLSQDISHCLGDPFYLLNLVEQRARWQRKLDAAKGVYEMSCRNVFLIEEKLPLHAVAMYYHSLFVGNQLPATAPRIYAPLFLFESIVYLAEVLLKQQEPPLQYCGLRLVEHLLSTLVDPVPSSSLHLDVHKRFCEALCKIVGYSPQVALRQLGLHVLRQYVLVFDDHGKYLILKNLLETLQHDGLMGYLGGMYKDLVDKALDESGPLPEVYSGKMFREMLLLCVCVLPHDVKSDLLLHADRLCHALNILRYFAVRDKKDVTGFWQSLPDIVKRLLDPLGKALNFSMAHYKAYKERVEKGQSASDDELMQRQLNMLAVNITNSGMAGGDGDSRLPDIGRQEKLDVLASSITSLETLQSLYLIASEKLEQSASLRRNATPTES
ncbi:glomulin [Drosophila gunungcola]|uniref:glomulin n=1 Tax=Drosophila gunungcola TaxID=103775 RepID=UPI0022E01FE7|nr:glomulin [Drosophila gunungcola]